MQEDHVTQRYAVKKPWTAEEDSALLHQILDHGPHGWELISKSIPGRSGKQCRERWHNQLHPLLKRLPWSKEENWVLFILHSRVGNKWAKMQMNLPGRCDNAIKNHWSALGPHDRAALADELELILRHADPAEPGQSSASSSYSEQRSKAVDAFLCGKVNAVAE